MCDVEFHLKPSRYLLFFVGVLFISAIIVVFTLPLTTLSKMVVVLTLLIYGYTILNRDVLLSSPDAICAIRRLVDGRWIIQTRNNKSYFCALHGESTVTQLVIVLLMTIDNSFWKKSCVILKDSFIVKDDYRKLILALKQECYRHL